MNFEITIVQFYRSPLTCNIALINYLLSRIVLYDVSAKKKIKKLMGLSIPLAHCWPQNPRMHNFENIITIIKNNREKRQW